MPSRSETATPIQARGHATRERLIAAAAELLGEVGVERLSSNLICARAGVTPPAFYRYFKDKYAILETLGDRLMNAQNEAVAALLKEASPVTETHLRALIFESIRITEAFPGGPWILRALRAVPALQHVRINSHRHVSDLIECAAESRADGVASRIALQARLVVDMGYAAIELAFDEPSLSPAEIAEEAARALWILADAMQTRSAADG